MMKKLYQLRCLVLLLFMHISVKIIAQKPPQDFGKITIEDFKPQVCPADSNAHAYYIFDYGNCSFKFLSSALGVYDQYSAKNAFQVYYTHHFRLKIVDNQALSWANFQIPLLQLFDNFKEKVSNLRAFTYNIENGNIVKSKLDSKDIFLESTSEYLNIQKFAMPNVRSGSIIEVEYTVVSDFINRLPEWYFQHKIPTLQSEFHILIPEYYNYNHNLQGAHKITQNYDSKSASLRVDQGYQYAVAPSINTIKYNEGNFDYYATNIPAFPDETHLWSSENYISKLVMELSSIQSLNSPKVYFSKSWDNIIDNLLSNERFGLELENSSHMNNDAELLKISNTRGLELVEKALNFIKNKIKWNNQEFSFVSSSLSKVYKVGIGNCTDINLNLTLLLRKLGFVAYPLLLSTKDHGVMLPTKPSEIRSNYVVVLVIIDGNNYLLDATDPYSEINLLPIRCLNGKGLIVDANKKDWIDIMRVNKFSRVEYYKLGMNADLSVTGDGQEMLSGYAAYDFRKEVKEHTNMDELLKEKNLSDFKVMNFTTSSLDSINQGINLSYTITKNNFIDKGDSFAYFAPCLKPFFKENPFKSNVREFPIEYNYPYTIKQIYTYEIPENYEILEMPKPIILQINENKAKYSFTMNKTGNKITLITQFNIYNILYLPEEYEALKNFYKMIIDKQNENVVLKLR